MFKSIAKIGIISLCTYKLLSSDYTPLQLTEKVFTDRSFVGIENYCIGEYKGIPKAKDFSRKLKMTFKETYKNDSAAYVNMTLTDSSGKFGTDTYIFLVKDSVWKICAFRALAMTGTINKTIESYAGINDAELDSLIAKEKQSLHPNFKNKQEFLYLIDNAKLTVELDDNIIQHLINNIVGFEQIKEYCVSYRNTIGSKDKEESIITIPEEYKHLLLGSVYYTNDYIKFLIGGIGDNEVGFLYITDKTKVPQMNSKDYILIREIGNGWYLYKST